jgi:hypothetical protein
MPNQLVVRTRHAVSIHDHTVNWIPPAQHTAAYGASCYIIRSPEAPIRKLQVFGA